MLAFAVAFYALTKGATAQDQTVSTPSAKMEFVGSSGGIRLTPVNSGNWIKLSWEKAEELDTAGNVVQSVNNLASQTFMWSAPVTEDNADGIPVTTLGFTATFNNGATWAIDAFLTQATTTVQIPDPVAEGEPQTYTDVEVPDNSIEFVVSVSNWPWVNDDQSHVLRFGAELHTQKGSRDSGEDEATFSRVTSADYAKVTGQTDVRVTSKTDLKGGKATVLWTFPYFPQGTTLVFDPLLNGANVAGPSLALLASALLGSFLV